MENHVFYAKNNISVLLIGEMAINEELMTYAKGLCKSLHVSTTAEEIETLVFQHSINLIFGTPSFNNSLYLEVLHTIRQARQRVEMVLFLQPDAVEWLEDALALQCSRYLCMKTEAIYAGKHLRDAIDAISNKNIFLKDTQYFEALVQSSVVSQSDLEGNITYINRLLS